MRTLTVIALLLAPVAANAVSDDDVARRISKLSDQLKSPFCPGKTLLTCTSGRAYDLRQEMRAMMLAGKSDAQVIADLELRYGDDISNPPQPWYTFFVPFLPWVVGILLVGWALRRWLRAGKLASEADLERLARLRRQIDEED